MIFYIFLIVPFFFFFFFFLGRFPLICLGIKLRSFLAITQIENPKLSKLSVSDLEDVVYCPPLVEPEHFVSPSVEPSASSINTTQTWNAIRTRIDSPSHWMNPNTDSAKRCQRFWGSPSGTNIGWFFSFILSGETNHKSLAWATSIDSQRFSFWGRNWKEFHLDDGSVLFPCPRGKQVFMNSEPKRMTRGRARMHVMLDNT